jgi:hypothetical protein
MVGGGTGAAGGAGGAGSEGCAGSTGGGAVDDDAPDWLRWREVDGPASGPG